MAKKKAVKKKRPATKTTPKKRSDGRWLESLIAGIERILAPGFKVEVRIILRGEDGSQYAEFDIILSGYTGSMPIKCLIECRDRSGAAPAAWIQQLLGRRDGYGFQKVMAVATHGFSPGAIELAARRDIELRSVESLRAEDVAEWIPRFAPLLNRRGQLDRCQITTESIGEEVRGIPVAFDAAIFTVTWTDARQSISNLWNLIVNNDAAWTSIPHGTPTVQSFVASDWFDRVVSGSVDGVEMPIRSIEFEGTLHQWSSDIPLESVAQYSDAMPGGDGKRSIADVMTWKGGGSGNQFEYLQVSLIRNLANLSVE